MVTGQPTSGSDEVRRRREDSRTVVGCVREDGAVRRAQRTTQAPTAAGQYPNDTPLAEPLSQRSMGPPAGRSGSVDASSATRTEASGRKALAKLKLSKAGKRGETMRS